MYFMFAQLCCLNKMILQTIETFFFYSIKLITTVSIQASPVSASIKPLSTVVYEAHIHDDHVCILFSEPDQCPTLLCLDDENGIKFDNKDKPCLIS